MDRAAETAVPPPRRRTTSRELQRGASSESLPRADGDAHRRDAGSMFEGLRAKAEQQLQALVAQRRRRQTDVPRPPQVVWAQSGEVLVERVAEREPRLCVDAD